MDALSPMLLRVYTIGPLHLLLDQNKDDNLKCIGFNYGKKNLVVLDSKESSSVVYVNFGSNNTSSTRRVRMGLANSEQSFLWIIRPDLVAGDSAILRSEFVSQTKERYDGKLVPPGTSAELPSHRWFLRAQWVELHSRKYLCWYIEIYNNVKVDEIERLVRELMEGDKGKEMKTKAMMWKKKAEEATTSVGSSSLNFDNMVWAKASFQ
ncbi:hypothetical protein NE237_016777 [Protea cynaroides]|uniref:Uncharacterized protein n=1 Tax=Protea cynaroides TaxID=273540 RepID=A0A9Q0HHJ1_9MAGN|nr:hypothetical protein NE237_016777 [Protea cynaroides]